MNSVLRIENYNEEGFYYSDSKVAIEMQEMDGRHPTPRNDSLLMRNYNKIERDVKINDHMWRYSFSDMAQLNYWIYKDAWRETLKEEGYVLNELYLYDDDIIIGYTQAMYNPSKEKNRKVIQW